MAMRAVVENVLSVPMCLLRDSGPDCADRTYALTI
jgi:hypothetical protein